MSRHGETVGMDLSDTSQWLPLSAACDQLQKSERTIERLVKSGDLKTQMETRAGRRAERMYHAGDLARIAELGIESKAETGKSLVPRSEQTSLVHVVERAANRYFGTVSRVPTHLKLWLSLPEAVEYSGLARTTLLQAIRREHLQAVLSNGWKIRRQSLETWDCNGTRDSNAGNRAGSTI